MSLERDATTIAAYISTRTNLSDGKAGSPSLIPTKACWLLDRYE